MPGPVLLELPELRWHCPACELDDVSRAAVEPGAFVQRMHNCPSLAGLLVPMLPAGVNAKLEAVEREDWIGDELVPLDGEGRPVMAVVTTRDDGQDCTVYAPTATAKGMA